MSAQIIEVNIDQVVVGKRPRTDDGDLSVLENSIRELGLLHPIVLDCHNVLIAGGRRLQACRNVGLQKIAARKLDVKAGSMRALQVQTDENLCRHDLAPEELDTLIDAKRHAARPRPGSRGVFGEFFAAVRERFRAGTRA